MRQTSYRESTVIRVIIEFRKRETGSTFRNNGDYSFTLYDSLIFHQHRDALIEGVGYIFLTGLSAIEYSLRQSSIYLTVN